MSPAVLDDHLASCADCARWLDEATRLTRLARLGTADAPQLTDPIMASAVLPARRAMRRRTAVRIALLVVGALQLAVGLPSLFGGSIDMAMSTHGAHETAAWSLALGAALMATAIRPRRTSGLLPVLTVFVGVLAVLSIRDIAGGAVEAGRLASHLGTVAGLLLVLVLDRTERSLPPHGVVEVEDDGPVERGDGLRGVA